MVFRARRNGSAMFRNDKLQVRAYGMVLGLPGIGMGADDHD